MRSLGPHSATSPRVPRSNAAQSRRQLARPGSLSKAQFGRVFECLRACPRSEPFHLSADLLSSSRVPSRPPSSPWRARRDAMRWRRRRFRKLYFGGLVRGEIRANLRRPRILQMRFHFATVPRQRLPLVISPSACRILVMPGSLRMPLPLPCPSPTLSSAFLPSRSPSHPEQNIHSDGSEIGCGVESKSGQLGRSKDATSCQSGDPTSSRRSTWRKQNSATTAANAKPATREV